MAISSKEILGGILPALKECGGIALELLDHSAPTLKPDFSVLTQADLAVSKLLRQRLAPFLSQPGHILIDEEDGENSRYFDADLLSENPYLWAIDPIDGTRSYANRMPLFGISIGVLRDLKPWIGACYFPALGELFYSDGETAYFVRKAFLPEEKATPLMPVDVSITRQSVFFGNDGFFKEHDWDLTICTMMMPSCAVIDFCWPTIGRGCGCMFNSYIWDFTGAWPIARAAGLEIRALRTGQVMEKIDLALFQGKGPATWRLRESYILSSSRNFPIITQQGIRPKAGRENLPELVP